MKFIILILFLFLFSCCNDVKEGIVVSKKHVDKHYVHYNQMVPCGKGWMFIPQKRVIHERWCVVISDTNARQKNIDVPYNAYIKINVGDYLNISGDTLKAICKDTNR